MDGSRGREIMGSAWPTADKFPSRQPLSKLSVLMPVFNERWTLQAILRRVLKAPIPLEIEIVVVDDGSTDGSWDELQRLAAREPRILLLRHPNNLGKGAAIRTAIDAMTGDVAIVQDADLEYDPDEYGRLLQPILDDRADAVYGSRYAGGTRQIHAFWHTMANRVLTLACNVLFNLTLSDMETCYKMVRADVLRQLRLTSRTFTFEPELTARLVQWGARIHEVPISYAGRSFHEGKKIRPIDAVKALAEMARCRFFDTRFTYDHRTLARWSWGRARRCRRWVLQQIAPSVGQRVLEIGPGLGGGPLVLDRPHVVLVDEDECWCDRMKRRYGHRDNVRVIAAAVETWHEQLVAYSSEAENEAKDRFDTVIFSGIANKPQSLSALLPRLAGLLADEGCCVMLLPDDPAIIEHHHTPAWSHETDTSRLAGIGLSADDAHAPNTDAPRQPPKASSAPPHSSHKTTSEEQHWRAVFKAAGLEVVRIESVGRVAAWLGTNGRGERLSPEAAARRAARLDIGFSAVRWVDHFAGGHGLLRLVIARKTRSMAQSQAA